MLSIEFFKSADIPAFERRQEALLGRLQHLQGSVQKLRESVGLADSSTREVSNHVSGSNFLALHIYWQLERGQKILLGMLSLKLHRSNSFNLIYMQRLSCANNAFTINWAALKIKISRGARHLEFPHDSGPIRRTFLNISIKLCFPSLYSLSVFIFQRSNGLRIENRRPGI